LRREVIGVLDFLGAEMHNKNVRTWTGKELTTLQDFSSMRALAQCPAKWRL
jgi:hypothetical protein